MKPTYNPGNLHVRLGTTLSLYEQAVFTGDLEKANNILGIIETYATVHLTPTQLGTLTQMPGFAFDDDRNASQIFQDMNRRLSYILNALKEHNVFTRATIEIGSAEALDE